MRAFTWSRVCVEPAGIRDISGFPRQSDSKVVRHSAHPLVEWATNCFPSTLRAIQPATRKFAKATRQSPVAHAKLLVLGLRKQVSLSFSFSNGIMCCHIPGRATRFTSLQTRKHDQQTLSGLHANLARRPPAACFSAAAGRLLRCLVLAIIAATSASMTSLTSAEPNALYTSSILERLDLSHPDVARAKALMADDRGRALEAWRDAVVNRLRRSDLGHFDYHDVLITDASIRSADLFVGRTGVPPSTTADNRAFVDLYGISGPPNSPPSIDWTATASEALLRERSAYGTFGFSLPLVAAYWSTRDGIYLRKWLDIVGDFARNQKRAVERLPVADRRMENAPWIKHAVSCLHQADRTIVILRSLAALAKSLPSADGTPQPKWGDSLRPLLSDADPTATAAIPAGDLAAIALSLTDDHTPLLLDAYEEPGELPNQRLNGLTSLLLTTHLFPEISGMRDIERRAGASLMNYLEETFYEDGGMLEQSLNYNLGDLEKLRQLRLLMGSTGAEWLPMLTKRIRDFLLLLEAIRTPAQELPIIGNNDSNPPPLWTSQTLRDKWFAAKDLQNPRGLRPTVAPGSCAFPYSGYYVQRRDATWDSPYLFFMNARPATGHHAMDNLAIEVHAFGRPLLVRAGPPFYSPKFLPPDRRPDATEIEEYFGEPSSYKVNTVIVDGKSQCRSGPPATSASASPIAERWHSSDAFDLVEGTYSLGYGEARPGTVADGDRSVTHRRRVIFVRRLGAWLVADTMAAADGRPHDYARVWKFPPRLTGSSAGNTPVHGFSASEVVLDGRGIHTADPQGPNLWIFQAGNQPMSHVRFYGNRHPYRGWYARYLGDVTPAVDVHSQWTATGTSTQVAILWPRRDATPPPVTRITRPSDDGDTGPLHVTVMLAGGEYLAYSESQGDRLALTSGPVRCKSEMLLTVGRGAQGIGLAIGADVPSANAAHTPSGSEPHDVEFTFREGDLRPTALIQRANCFRWSPSPTGLVTKVVD